MALPSATEGSDLTCAFHLSPGEVTITISVPTASPEMPEEEGFAWQVLTALTTHAEFAHTEGKLIVSLTMRSTVAARAAYRNRGPTRHTARGNETDECCAVRHPI